MHFSKIIIVVVLLIKIEAFNWSKELWLFLQFVYIYFLNFFFILIIPHWKVLLKCLNHLKSLAVYAGNFFSFLSTSYKYKKIIYMYSKCHFNSHFLIIHFGYISKKIFFDDITQRMITEMTKITFYFTGFKCEYLSKINYSFER